MKKTTKTKKNSVGLEPLADRILVKEIKVESAKKTSSGIYIPDNAKEDRGTKRGEVVAVGDGRFEDGKLVPMKIKVGETILFQWADVVTYKGEEYYIIRETEVAAIIR